MAQGFAITNYQTIGNNTGMVTIVSSEKKGFIQYINSSNEKIAKDMSEIDGSTTILPLYGSAILYMGDSEPISVENGAVIPCTFDGYEKSFVFLFFSGDMKITF